MRIEAALNYNRAARIMPMGIDLAAAVARLSLSPRVGGYKLRPQVPSALEKVGDYRWWRLRRAVWVPGA